MEWSDTGIGLYVRVATPMPQGLLLNGLREGQTSQHAHIDGTLLCVRSYWRREGAVVAPGTIGGRSALDLLLWVEPDSISEIPKGGLVQMAIRGLGTSVIRRRLSYYSMGRPLVSRVRCYSTSEHVSGRVVRSLGIAPLEGEGSIPDTVDRPRLRQWLNTFALVTS